MAKLDLILKEVGPTTLVVAKNAVPDSNHNAMKMWTWSENSAPRSMNFANTRKYQVKTSRFGHLCCYKTFSALLLTGAYLENEFTLEYFHT